LGGPKCTCLHLDFNQRLGMIKRSFTYMEKNMFTTLYKSIVCPHLEYGSNIWSVMHKKEAIQTQNVQNWGKLFQVSTTLWEKLYFLILVLQCFL
jgi:hypothetical protein